MKKRRTEKRDVGQVSGSGAGVEQRVQAEEDAGRRTNDDTSKHGSPHPNEGCFSTAQGEFFSAGKWDEGPVKRVVPASVHLRQEKAKRFRILDRQNRGCNMQKPSYKHAPIRIPYRPRQKEGCPKGGLVDALGSRKAAELVVAMAQRMRSHPFTTGQGNRRLTHPCRSSVDCLQHGQSVLSWLWGDISPDRPHGPLYVSFTGRTDVWPWSDPSGHKPSPCTPSTSPGP